MDEPNKVYSTQAISPQLVSQIVEAIKDKDYGSVEIYIENYNVVQITERRIKKFSKSIAKKRFSIVVRRNGNFSRPQQ